MHDSLRSFCFLSLFFCFWWTSPILAETSSSDTMKSSSPGGDVKSSKQPDRKLPQRLVPFAHYEETLKNSEHWKTLSPEEQEEALENIQEHRKRFFQRQVERQKQYDDLLEKNVKKGPKRSRRNVDSQE